MSDFLSEPLLKLILVSLTQDLPEVELSLLQYSLDQDVFSDAHVAICCLDWLHELHSLHYLRDVPLQRLWARVRRAGYHFLVAPLNLLHPLQYQSWVRFIAFEERRSLLVRQSSEALLQILRVSQFWPVRWRKVLWEMLTLQLSKVLLSPDRS